MLSPGAKILRVQWFSASYDIELEGRSLSAQRLIKNVKPQLQEALYLRARGGTVFNVEDSLTCCHVTPLEGCQMGTLIRDAVSGTSRVGCWVRDSGGGFLKIDMPTAL